MKKTTLNKNSLPTQDLNKIVELVLKEKMPNTMKQLLDRVQ